MTEQEQEWFKEYQHRLNQELHIEEVPVGIREVVKPVVKESIGHKDTKGKLPLNLVPPRAYESIAKVREFGNSKYQSPWGWLTTTTPEQYIEAARRHLLKIDLGEELDPESGLLHLEHALCSLAMAVELKKRKG